MIEVLRGFLLHPGEDVAAEAKGDPDVGVSEHLVDHPGMGALAERQRGRSIAQVM
jgi:hypothetical protein